MSDTVQTAVDLWQFFQGQSRDFSKQPALASEKGVMTFAELFKVAEQTAITLAKAGIKEGHVVALAWRY